MHHKDQGGRKPLFKAVYNTSHKLRSNHEINQQQTGRIPQARIQRLARRLTLCGRANIKWLLSRMVIVQQGDWHRYWHHPRVIFTLRSTWKNFSLFSLQSSLVWLLQFCWPNGHQVAASLTMTAVAYVTNSLAFSFVNHLNF